MVWPANSVNFKSLKGINCSFWFLVWILFAVFSMDSVVATPIVAEEVDFDDPWDYGLSPHNDPLLKHTSTLHDSNERTSKQHDEGDYDKELLEEFQELGYNDYESKLSCGACRFAVALLKCELFIEMPFEVIKVKFIGICMVMNIATKDVCSGMADRYGPVILTAFKTTELNPKKICGLLMGDELCGNVENPLHEWTIDLPELSSDDDIWQSPAPPEDGSTFKVLHLTDTHFDPFYSSNSFANCKEPLCCRTSSTPSGDKAIPAGKWGSFGKCDVPQDLIENMLEHIAKEHPDIDYVIWTGDIPPHDVWNQTAESNTETFQTTTRLLLDAFPNIPIFPSIGNHESVPAGNFPPPWMKNQQQTSDWIYEEFSNEWSKWLPEKVNATVIRGGFYSVLLRPKFRLISMNMNFCYAHSWWLVVNSTDPSKELRWLVHELQLAEQNEEKVHIIGHVPPGGHDCLKVWSRNYNEIIKRFKNTVVAQFFGHTHYDEFEVFYSDDELNDPTAIAYLAPSVTTFENLNPGYRIYYIDGDRENATREVIDSETWIMDLLEANSNPDNNPEWYKLYSARSAYDITTLRPVEWAGLIDKMGEDSELFDLFYRHYHKNSPVRPTCDKKCKCKIICDQKSAKSHSKATLCKKERSLFQVEKK